MALRDPSVSLYSMKKTPVQARSKATVDAILGAATGLLFKIGYEKTSTNRIAEATGVSIGSLYEYFPGKDAIYLEIRRRHDRKMYEPYVVVARTYLPLR